MNQESKCNSLQPHKTRQILALNFERSFSTASDAIATDPKTSKKSKPLLYSRPPSRPELLSDQFPRRTPQSDGRTSDSQDRLMENRPGGPTDHTHHF